MSTNSRSSVLPGSTNPEEIGNIQDLIQIFVGSKEILTAFNMLYVNLMVLQWNDKLFFLKRWLLVHLSVPLVLNLYYILNIT